MRNDEADFAFAREQVLAGDLVILAGRKGDVVRRLAEVVDQDSPHLLGVQRLLGFQFALSLQQQDRADEFSGIRFFLGGGRGQLVQPADSVGNGVIRVGPPAQHHGQLNHLRGFQLRRRNLVQDVRRDDAFRRVRLGRRDRRLL